MLAWQYKQFYFKVSLKLKHSEIYEWRRRLNRRKRCVSRFLKNWSTSKITRNYTGSGFKKKSRSSELIFGYYVILSAFQKYKKRLDRFFRNVRNAYMAIQTALFKVSLKLTHSEIYGWRRHWTDENVAFQDSWRSDQHQKLPEIILRVVIRKSFVLEIARTKTKKDFMASKRNSNQTSPHMMVLSEAMSSKQCSATLNILTSVFHASVLLLIMDFFIVLSK